CDASSAGREIILSIGDQSVTGKVASSGDWDHYMTFKLDKLRVEQTGPVTIALKAAKKPGFAVMNLRAVVFTPVKS
ncbi:MAG TPA: hypothetical protein VGC39_04170, partial [Candidatus Methylacidiphilales bacterium]